MAVILDPRAVLVHLNQLGYCNISAEQLRDFIRDLKKLIKYDQQKCQCHKPSNVSSPGSSYVETSPETVQTGERSLTSISSYKHDSGSLKNHCQRNNINKQREVKDSCKQPRQKCAHSAWHVAEEPSNSSDSISSSLVDLYVAPAKIKHAEKITNTKGQQNSKSLKNLQEATKPRSSFIKPWRLHTASLPQRSDPVAMYHRYQILWQQQKVPGEDGHAELRWSVREKMLGQDPHPRKSRDKHNKTSHGGKKRERDNSCLCSKDKRRHFHIVKPVSQASGREVVFKCQKKLK